MSAELWDAVVVGAGPAGAAAAYDLAAGCRVLLADRAAFPRAKACAGGLTMKAVRALPYSIDPVVRRWIRELVLEEAPGRAVTTARRRPVCAMTVREELDAFCLHKTVERGARFRRIGAITAMEQREDRVVLRCADAVGQEETLEARFVIGADGVHSRVRALAGEGARWFRRGFAVEANVPYRDGEALPPLLFDFAPVAGGYGWLFPRDNHVNVGLYVADDAVGSPGALNRAALERYIAARCGAGCEIGPTVGQFLGLGAAGYRPREDARVLLAGDAAGFVDPLTGEGIYGAIRSGQAAAEAILGALALETATAGRSRRAVLPGRLTGERSRALPPAAGYRAATRRLRTDLKIAEHGAKRFYGEPARGFRLMRLPLLPRAALKVYSDGLPLSVLLRTARLAGHLLPASAGTE